MSDFCAVVRASDVEALAQVVVVLSLLCGFLASFVGHSVALLLDRLARRCWERQRERRRAVTM